MMAFELDPRMTFDTFVVGPGNRLASAAARRAADSPAASYNPLFLYSASGLGKSHILNAMAHHAERLNPEGRVLYQTLEGYLDELAEAIQSGHQEELKDRYRDLDILLLDDVQFLTGQPEAQDLLLLTLDSLNLSGSQIVLASDRPPAEIDGLDARLLSRFSGGLMVDIAPPEYETRVSIVRKKLEGRSGGLDDDVADAIARLPFRNVRELMGGLNRVLATQDLEGRSITSEDVARLVDMPSDRPRRVRRADRLTKSFMHEGMFEAPEEPWQRQLREAAETAEAEGFSAARLRRILEGDLEPTDPDAVIAEFESVLETLRQIRSDLDVVGNPWPEAARGVLMDPDRLEEARALLASAQERVRAFPPFLRDVDIDHLPDGYPAIAVKAARQLLSEEPPEYNPLFVWSKDGHGARGLLEAAATTWERQRPGARVAMVSAKEFADEFIAALADGVAGAWRERWWTVEFLLVYGCQELSHAERAQDEFFHLFEAVTRRGARVMLAADRKPTKVGKVDDRLKSRFESGLVVEVEVVGSPPPSREELLARYAQENAGAMVTSLDGMDEGGEVRPDLSVARPEDADRAPEELDPEFQASLQGLEAGSERHALIPPSAAKGPMQAALTNLSLQPDDFPTLLSEAEKGRRAAGVERGEQPDGVEASADESREPEHDSNERDSSERDSAERDSSERDSSEPTGASTAGGVVTAADLDVSPASPVVGQDGGDAADAVAIREEGEAPQGAATDSSTDSSTDALVDAPEDDGAEDPAAAGDPDETDGPELPMAVLDRVVDAVFAPYEDAPTPPNGSGVRVRSRSRVATQADPMLDVHTATDTAAAAVAVSDSEQGQEATDGGVAPTTSELRASTAPSSSTASSPGPEGWAPSPERVVWHWPDVESRIVSDD